ncbi:major facilitator superfamily domain-containing protein [Echria macrotheca]|uniref:Major facilitator superfamily domain-containing protein n=1 Tax=Echria macrotheca TaxID=438768 RepID=A0AAJ0BJ35_9PEZI|nr:major facilitator superfamily domain-containing protein [Echria macrotheca]
MSTDSEMEKPVGGEAASPAPKVPPPPNGGLHAWIQVLGAHFLFFNSWGIVNSFGLFQTYYETTLLKSRTSSEISWIGTFQAFLLVASGLAAGPIFDRGHFRALVIVGTFLSVFGMMMTSLATEYWQLFLAQGLCVGLGTGCLFLPSVAIVATYFTTKRALAIGIVAAGGSIGSVIYPIVFYQLQPRLGFPWATRILAFIILGTLSVSILVLRTRVPPAGKSRAIFDLAAFRSATFDLYSLGLFLSFVGLYVPIFYIILWAEKHVHVDAGLSFYLLALLNGSSTFGRIIPGLLADRFGPFELTIVCTVLAAVFAYVAIVIDTLGGLVVFAILYGFVSGAVVSLPSAVIATLVPDMSLVGTWMGMSFCFAGTGILVGNPIAGTIIDVEGDRFAGGFIFSGSLVMAAGALSIAARYLHLSEKRRAR